MLIDQRTKALMELGWIKPIDGLFAVIIIISFWALFSWSVFGTPSVWQSIGILTFMILTLQSWGILLAYRVCLLLLECRAEINTLPDQAAQVLIKRSAANQPA